jgi:hypothetical protein
MTDSESLFCELCETEMSNQTPPGRAVRYFHCARCGRWVASNYGEELVRAHTARVASRARAAAGDGDELDRVKERLRTWLQALDERDPYHVLGVSPSASEDRVRARFHELALQHHPDHGGDAEQMRKVNEAFDRIRSGKRLRAPPTTVKVAAAAVAGRRRG